ncbi:MAG: holo-ACP synthase [Oscillospiraceae bacterium]|jgi:holo-[acyl-carrier protein] synthase|nr:holo-ACP synthase [Oscillospiraceae bacterium]
MIVGIGYDLCSVNRFADKNECRRFAARWFSLSEREYLAERSYAAQTAAGIFAAKEACLKVFGLPLFGVPMQDISIEHDSAGKPYLRCPALVGGNTVHISITHEGDVAGAMCVAEGTRYQV